MTATPSTAPAIQPATILIKARSSGQLTATSINTPMYCTAKALTLQRQFLLINNANEVMITITAAGKAIETKRGVKEVDIYPPNPL
jgi:hypothetical protein